MVCPITQGDHNQRAAAVVLIKIYFSITVFPRIEAGP